MTPKSALHEYGLMVLRYETLYRALFENKAVRGFLGAVPGLDAYAMLGKAWWHTTELVGGPPALRPGDRRRPGLGPRRRDAAHPPGHPGGRAQGPAGPRRRGHARAASDPTRFAFVIVTLAEELPARETAEPGPGRRARP